MKTAVVDNKEKKKTKKKIEPELAKVLDLQSHSRPNIIVVGKRDVMQEIGAMDKNLNLNFIFSNKDNLEALLNKKTISVMIDEKEVSSDIHFISEVVQQFQLLPIFLLARNKHPDEFYQNLYAQGLQGVFDWPAEAENVTELLIESLKTHKNTVGKTRADKRLAEMVKSHLLMRNPLRGIKVKVIEGFVFLEGKVKSLYEKEVSLKEANKVLGVEKTITTDIKIINITHTTEQEIERKIRIFVKNLMPEMNRTIKAQVVDHKVILKGSISNKRILRKIVNFVSKQPGIMEVENQVRISKKLAKRNLGKVKKAEERVRNIFEGVKSISIRMYGESAEVTGIVSKNTQKHLVEKYVLQMLPVKKVLNKLSVIS